MNILLAIALLLTQPATFEINTEGIWKHTDCVVIMENGQRLRPGVVYKTHPFFGEIAIEIEVRWVDGDYVRRKKDVILLRSGFYCEVKVEIPRVSSVWRDV